MLIIITRKRITVPILDNAQIATISDIVANAFVDRSVEIISHLNQTNKLDLFLKITGLKSLVSKEQERTLMSTKKVLVVGAGMAKESDYRRKLRDASISSENFEFHLGYHDAKKIDFDKYKNNPEYGGIIVGPMDHNGISKGNYSSIIDYIENEPGFPLVVRGNEGGPLKLSLDDFYIATLKLLGSGALTDK